MQKKLKTFEQITKEFPSEVNEAGDVWFCGEEMPALVSDMKDRFGTVVDVEIGEKYIYTDTKYGWFYSDKWFEENKET